VRFLKDFEYFGFNSEALREFQESVAKNGTPFALAVAVTELILKWYPCCQDYTMNRNKKVDSEERFCHWRCRVRGYMEKRPCCLLPEPDTVERASIEAGIATRLGEDANPLRLALVYSLAGTASSSCYRRNQSKFGSGWASSLDLAEAISRAIGVNAKCIHPCVSYHPHQLGC